MDLTEEWRTLSGALGYEYTDIFSVVKSHPRIIHMIGKEIQLFKQYEAKSEKLSALAGKILKAVTALYPGGAVGEEGDMTAAMFPFGRNPSTQVTDYKRHILHTYLVILYPEPLDFEFQINGSPPPKGILRKIFGKSIIETGTDPEFDASVTSTSASREKLSEILRDDDLRKKILELARLPWSLRITEEGIRMMKNREIVTLQEAESVRNITVDTARKLFMTA
jgi:hypothetical protein